MGDVTDGVLVTPVPAFGGSVALLRKTTDAHATNDLRQSKFLLAIGPTCKSMRYVKCTKSKAASITGDH